LEGQLEKMSFQMTAESSWAGVCSESWWERVPDFRASDTEAAGAE